MLYTLCNPDTDVLDVPLFELPGKEGATFAVFTSLGAAKNFASCSQNSADQGVAELKDSELLRLVDRLLENRVSMVVVDPVPESAPARRGLQTIATHRLADSASHAILNALEKASTDPQPRLKPLLIVSCEKCGGVLRIGLDDTLPYCCDTVMQVAAHDSELATS